MTSPPDSPADSPPSDKAQAPPPGGATRSGSTRRGFLRKGLLGGAILVVGGSMPLWLRSVGGKFRPRGKLHALSSDEYAIFAAAAARIVPGEGASAAFPSADALDCAGKVDALVARLDPGALADFRRLLHVFENAFVGLVSIGSPVPFSRSDPAAQVRRLEAWRHSRLSLFRSGYQAIRRLSVAVYYSSPETYAGVGYPGPPVVPQVPV